MINYEALHEAVKKNTLWWITDMCYRPPEITTEAYYNKMAEDIAANAVEFVRQELNG